MSNRRECVWLFSAFDIQEYIFNAIFSIAMVYQMAKNIAHGQIGLLLFR